jgi:PA domain/Secretion system C-terminal sorting domain
MKKIVLFTLVLSTFFYLSCSKSKTESNSKSNEIPKSSVVQSNAEIQEDKTQQTSSTSQKPLNAGLIAKKAIVSNNQESKELSKTDILRKKHEHFLKNSPFNKVINLSKSERKAMGIPPNKYYESEWELTMNPETGRPNPENLIALRKKLERERNDAIAEGRTPGDAADNNWVERGPSNVGGRTRGVMFDPNDATKETVFAGGVSGGLWKNTNISNANSVWTRVNIPENLSVSSITYDPNNTNIFYVGTGESYVGGDVSGDGVWKSTNGGLTFSKVFGGVSGPTTFQSATNLTINSPAGVAGNYVCFPTTAFGPAVTVPITADLVLVNDGTATPTLGCFPPTNASQLSGKIALINRGDCTFVLKIKAAQDAGAIGVIMINNIDGQPIPMGGDDTTITIPSAMISKADGQLLLAAGALNGTMNPTTVGGFTGNLVPGKQHINDIKIRNNNGVSEIYVAVGDTFYSAANAATYLGGPDYGLYKSVDGGVTWTELTMPLTANGNKHCPNDIAIGADNKVWVSTTRSTLYNDGGGKVFSSTDGINFVSKYTVVDGNRTQIASSRTIADKIYLLAELTTGLVTIKKTSNGFTTTTDMALPVDGDTSIPANDFTRGQAFYDLMLEVDPLNDETVYAGGIDLFKSTDGAGSWFQLSHWYGGFGYQNVHADQHALAFANGGSNRLIFGNDGGVYFSNNGGTTTAARNTGFNVTQFYSVAVAPTNTVSGLNGDYFVSGAQDNGSQYFANAPAGISASTEVQGGDGAICLFDQGADKYYITNYVYNQNINYRLAVSPFTVRNLDNDASSANNGAFICPMALDSNLDILYSDYSTTAPLYQIRRYTNIKSGIVNRLNLTNALLTAPPTALTVSKYTTTSTTLLVGTRLGKLLKVTNANLAAPVWTDISGPAFVGSISDVEYGATENDIFVTFHNYNVVSIWYTSNGGTTWQNKEGNFPDIPVKAILQNPLNTNEVIIGTELGVWFTNTFNTTTPTWNQSFNGMSNVKVTDMDLRNDNTVYASTYGRGVFSGLFTATSLNVNELEVKNDVTLYPNPSNGIINLSIANYIGKLEINLFDMNGRKVLSNLDSFSNEKTLNLGNLQSGMYIIQLVGDNGFVYSQKVLIDYKR